MKNNEQCNDFRLRRTLIIFGTSPRRTSDESIIFGCSLGRRGQQSNNYRLQPKEIRLLFFYRHTGSSDEPLHKRRQPKPRRKKDPTIHIHTPTQTPRCLGSHYQEAVRRPFIYGVTRKLFAGHHRKLFAGHPSAESPGRLSQARPFICGITRKLFANHLRSKE